MKEFKKFEGVFDAITAFAERSEIEFFLIHKNKSGRFLQSDEETQQLDISNKEIAFSCASCFSINEDCLIELIRYLFERWLHWDRRKRESVCEIYKSYLSESFKFSMLFLNESFNELKAKVESNQEHRISIVDQVWPDWEGDSRKKFIRTISVSLKGFVNADSNVLDQFVNFISSSGLESFFWQLEIFEDHALRGNSFRTSGMHASIQGMALVVEHIVRSLTSSIPGTVIRGRDDLLDHFKALFAKNSLISALLKDNGITGPARERLESLEDWNKMREHLKTLRSKGGEDSMVADLVAARYVRGAVHYKFPGAGHFELEELFVTLMRAAFFCFDAKRQLIIKANQ